MFHFYCKVLFWNLIAWRKCCLHHCAQCEGSLNDARRWRPGVDMENFSEFRPAAKDKILKMCIFRIGRWQALLACVAGVQRKRERRNLEARSTISGRGKWTALSTPLFLSLRLIINYAKPRKLWNSCRSKWSNQNRATLLRIPSRILSSVVRNVKAWLTSGPDTTEISNRVWSKATFLSQREPKT